MTSENDLYTDYALQLFTSYVTSDLTTIQDLLESFRDEEQNLNNLFMPGVIYGLMYHMAAFMNTIAIELDCSIQDLISKYAMDYAINREELMDNPLLNVKKATSVVEELMEKFKILEELDEDSLREFFEKD